LGHGPILEFRNLKTSSPGKPIASVPAGEQIMHRFWKSALLGAVLMVPVTVTPTALRADDRRYEDKEHHDQHAWNAQEDRAYRRWAKENHRKYATFAKLKEEDQQAYWRWRHDHPDERR
jgi:hypothetical protein